MTDLLRPPGHRTEPAPRPADGPPGAGGDPAVALAGERSWLGLAGLVAALAAVVVFLGVNVLVVILGVVLSIFLHEAGHYLAARRSGMKATEFFLGFGPRIWSFRRGETEYGVKAIWAGAYVKIIGMNNLEEVPAADEARTYRQASYPRRMATVFAGPAMNLVICFALVLGLSVVVGMPALESSWPQVDPAEGSAADQAGLLRGDKLLRVDGGAVPSFDEFRQITAARAGDEMEVVVERDGQELTRTIELGTRVAGISSPRWPEGIQVNVGTPGWAANLGYDDVIVQVDGESAPETFAAFVDRVLAARGTALPLVVERDGRRFATDLVVPPDAVGEGLLGVSEYVPDPEPAGLIEAVPAAADRFAELGWMSMYGLYSFFSPSGLSGFAENVVTTGPSSADREPAGVPAAEHTSESALPPLPAPDAGMTPDEDRVLSLLGIVRLGGQLELIDVVWLIAVMNMFLAIFNLVPLLPFDGGHMLLATYERVREGLARRRLVAARLQGGRYFADFAKLIPLTYAVVAVIAFVGLGALWLDAIDPPQVNN